MDRLNELRWDAGVGRRLRVGMAAVTMLGGGLGACVGLTGCNGFFIDGHTSTVLTSSAVTAGYGTSVVLTATVSTKSATGTVEFFDGSTELGTATLSSGVATYTTTALTEATHTLTAEYEGDNTYSSSTSSALTVVISATLTSTTTTISPSATSITSGSSVTFTANVSTVSATGTVTFYSANGTGTYTALGTASLVANTTTSTAQAVYPTAALPKGTNTVYAAYIGDSTYASSSSGTVSVTVN